MTANIDHLATLRLLRRNWIGETPDAPGITATDAALDAAIRALSADRGEAVSGVAMAAAYIQKKADDYALEHCSSEPDTGAAVYHYGRPGEEYHHTLIELAEEVAALATPPSPAESAAPSGVSDAAVKRAVHVFANQPSGSYCDGTEERLMRAVLEDFARQPQPGRVEGKSK